jgi:hypothetical protein
MMAVAILPARLGGKASGFVDAGVEQFTRPAGDRCPDREKYLEPTPANR